MAGVVISVLIFFLLAGGLGGSAYLIYRKKLRRAKAIERGLKMVPILIHLPPQSSDTQSGTRDMREVMREKTAQAEVLYNLLAGTATEGFKSNFYGQRHIALELIVSGGLVHFFAAVPVALVGVVKQAVTTAYPGSRLEEVEDHNIFNKEGRLAATLGGEMVLRADTAYPIATYEQLERDPMEAILTSVSTLEKQDGVAIQIMLRPAGQSWVKHSLSLADSLRQGKTEEFKFSAMDLAKAALKSPNERREEEKMRTGGTPQVSQLQLSQVERIEEKTKHPGFEVLVRVIVSTGSVMRSQQLLREISTAFALYENPGLNGFKFLPAVDVQGLVTAFIFRFFPNELKSNVLSSAELATLFHLPDAQFTPSTSVARQQSKQVDGPVQLPAGGMLFGYNEFRGARKEIRLSPEDRRRHTYILGQTGTGKSTMLENLAVQDMVAGNGFAFIDPHGDSAEKLLALVPKERAEDVIYFNPADTLYPLGLNLFEFNDPAQKDFLVQETINMLYKLYDPGHTGIIGPRYEHWYRNAALTLMADPNGATFIEIPKVFTDTEYLKTKFKYLKDPTVIDFWTKEMGQTSDYHKSEMLGWFVSKFGAFQNNEMMRNIIGQTKSSFNIRDVMDKKKILIVNLSKGRIGELNSQLLGMIFVIKFQAAAMSRADMPEDQRTDFALYVDEFQNFSTDSFASILSEARKYRLNLIVANQFVGQLSTEIRDAVFGNIGTIVAHRMGPDDAEFMTKQFAPVFDAGDLVNIPNYQAAMRLMIGGLPSQPFTIADSAPIGAPNAELGLAIKQLSAAKYGHNKVAVEADLVRRLSGSAAPAATMDAMPLQSGAPAPVAAVASAAVVTPAAVVAPAPVVVMPATTMPAQSASNVPLAALAVATATVAAPDAAPAAPMLVQSAAPLAAPDLAAASMAVAPPPIGAPPVDLGQMAAPTVEDDSLARIIELAGSSNDSPVLALAPEPAAEPVVAEGLVRTPPPIGAPPVDLGMPELEQAKPVSPGTLSLDDITGHKREIVENDPYAGIDLLGPAVPRAGMNQAPEPEAIEPAAISPVTIQPEPAPQVSPEPVAAVEPVAAEAVEAQSVAQNSDSNMTNGLPEGVHFLNLPNAPTFASEPTLEPVAVQTAAPVEPEIITDTMITMVPSEPSEPIVPTVPTVPTMTQVAPIMVAPAPNIEPVAVPEPASIAPADPNTSAIQQAEQEIDDLLSVSLLHPYQKLPSIDIVNNSEAESNVVTAPMVEMAMSPGSSVETPVELPAGLADEQMAASPAISIEEATPATMVTEPAEVPQQQPELVSEPVQFEVPVAVLENEPVLTPQDLDIIPEVAPVAEVALPAPVAELPEVELPQAQILGATPEVPVIVATAPAPQPEMAAAVPETVLLAPAAEPVAENEHEAVVAPEVNVEAKPAKAHNGNKRKGRKIKQGADEQSAEINPVATEVQAVPETLEAVVQSILPEAAAIVAPVVEPQEPAQAEAVSEERTSPMPGSAIMPQAPADRPMAMSAPTRRSADKVDENSLKAGEVYVDDQGNVVVGTGE